MTTPTNPSGAALADILNKYGVPDPKIVGKLPKGGTTLDFVGHADVTKMLIEADPNWTWEPVAFDTDGLPAYRVENGMAHMAGWMTIHGVRRLGIGSVQHNKPDLFKELCSDLIRNCAMRFGFCLSLWTKQEWDDVAAPAVSSKTIGNRPTDAKGDAPAKQKPTSPLSDEQVAQFRAACESKGLDADAVAEAAGIKPGEVWIQAHLSQLRATFKELVG